MLNIVGLALSSLGAVLALLASGVWQDLFQEPWSKLFEGRERLRERIADLLPARPGWSLLGLVMIALGFFFQFAAALCRLGG